MELQKDWGLSCPGNLMALTLDCMAQFFQLLYCLSSVGDEGSFPWSFPCREMLDPDRALIPLGW